jgi:hypothetical protein
MVLYVDKWLIYAERRRQHQAIQTINNVPTMALPKPPPVMPAAGGSSVNTLQLNSGSPFFKTRKTIENNGTSVRSARPTQIPLKSLLQRERTPTCALFADAKKSVGCAVVAVLAMIVSF